eukprot:TRINITY_DN40635_c0_g1_i1.p1 TRINITY_DN40635_c0_g1~~TRINITY_DN40635_c0_g1_i1.p1  ORF type:complete len:998 (+),score=242.40 TRINITY_DN40635_c0_g1_i1:72-3065(+)
MAWFGWGGTAPATGPPQSAPTLPIAGSASTYSVGETVEYFSASNNTWIPAKVLAVLPGGTYNLDCKPGVTPDKMRRGVPAPPPGSASGAGFAGAAYRVGDSVEYFGASQGRWIPAKVTAVNASGTYDLDCKPNVLPEKVRAPQVLASSSSVGSPKNRTPATRTRLGSPQIALGGELNIDEPVQLLRVQRQGSGWRYEVCQEGAQLLERYGSRRIAVASICGLYRTGKSFLLNMLLERMQRGLPLFKVGGTSQACTEGLWLWGSTDSKDENSPLLAFIDCEGFGSTDSDRTRDAHLMTLCTLLSSVLVLNTKGALNESLFNSLALTCRFAEHIEERGQEANRPSLLWVLRDFMLDLRDPQGRPITPDEYLEQALQAAPLAAGSDADRSSGAREVRQSLLKFFSHRGCVTLVQPAIEETQLQQLEKIPYTSLRGEFRAGVEALRTQLVATCHSNPKTIGGQPLGCNSFVALVRQLVTALNENKVLSMKGAWETVQHSACATLVEELRESAAQTLQTFSGGGKLTGGAQLPMTNEGLHVVLRDQRHSLKAEWLERAMGDEHIRKEYWQELKETVARHEESVKQQNSRLADQQLNAILKRWQDWLDDDASAAATGEEISTQFGQLVERMPAAPLSRAGRAAVEAAARRVSAARGAVLAAADHHAEVRAKAHALGEKASQQAEAHMKEIEQHDAMISGKVEEMKRVQQAEQAKRLECEAQMEELEAAKIALQAALRDLEDVRARVVDAGDQIQGQEQRATSLKAELEEVRAAAAKADAERVASEQCAEAAAAEAELERQRLEASLAEARALTEQTAIQLQAEREAISEETKRTKEEHDMMLQKTRTDHEQKAGSLHEERKQAQDEHGSMVAAARTKLEEERAANVGTLETTRKRLLEVERTTGVLEGQVQTMSAEASLLRDRLAELQETIRETESRVVSSTQHGERLKVEKLQAESEHASVREETTKRVEAQAQEHEVKYAELCAAIDKEEKVKPKCGCSIQ